jgi:DNA-binding NarL/FixJ family response regulator
MLNLDADWPDPDRRDEALWRGLIKVAAAPLVDEASLGKLGSGNPGRDPSKEELEVLEAFSRGLEWEGVAEILGRNFHTVKSQAKHARFLLQAKNTTEACCEALRRGLIR